MKFMIKNVYVLMYYNSYYNINNCIGIVEDNENFKKNLYEIFKKDAKDLIKNIDKSFNELIKKEIIEDKDYGFYQLEKHSLYS